VAEIAGALGILGLLLVFLPLYLQWVAEAAGGTETAKERRKRIAWAWSVPALIALASGDATVGLFALWGKWTTADLTGWLLLGLVWLIVVLAIATVARGVK
jgi:cadmium resistance protein CadD (predicted permease)